MKRWLPYQAADVAMQWFAYWCQRKHLQIVQRTPEEVADGVTGVGGMLGGISRMEISKKLKQESFQY